MAVPNTREMSILYYVINKKFISSHQVFIDNSQKYTIHEKVLPQALLQYVIWSIIIYKVQKSYTMCVKN